MAISQPFKTFRLRSSAPRFPDRFGARLNGGGRGFVPNSVSGVSGPCIRLVIMFVALWLFSLKQKSGTEGGGDSRQDRGTWSVRVEMRLGDMLLQKGVRKIPEKKGSMEDEEFKEEVGFREGVEVADATSSFINESEEDAEVGRRDFITDTNGT